MRVMARLPFARCTSGTIMLGLAVALLSLDPRPAGAAVVHTPLTSGGVQNVNSQDTASVAPSASALILVWVADHCRTAGPCSAPVSVSGLGLGPWVRFGADMAHPVNGITLFWTVTGPTAPTPGPLSIAFSGTEGHDVSWSVSEYRGVDVIAPILQSSTATVIAEALAIPYPTAPTTDGNALAAGFSIYGLRVDPSVTPRAGWSEVHEVSTQSLMLETQVRLSGTDTAASASWSATDPNPAVLAAGGIAIELLASPTFTVLKDFTDDSASSVDIALTCSSGSVLEASLPATEASPAVFTVVGADPSATCTASEVTVPPGYTVDESGCAGIGLLTPGTCTIVNASSASFPVLVDFTPDYGGGVSVSLTCTSGTVTNSPQMATEAAPAVFTVEGWMPGTTCTATAAVPLGFIVDDTGCGAVDIQSPGTCTLLISAQGAAIPALSGAGLLAFAALLGALSLLVLSYRRC